MAAAYVMFHTRLRRWRWFVRPLLTVAGWLRSIRLARWAVRRLIMETRTGPGRRATLIGRWRLELVLQDGQLTAVHREVWS